MKSYKSGSCRLKDGILTMKTDHSMHMSVPGKLYKAMLDKSAKIEVIDIVHKNSGLVLAKYTLENFMALRAIPALKDGNGYFLVHFVQNFAHVGQYQSGEINARSSDKVSMSRFGGYSESNHGWEE